MNKKSIDTAPLIKINGNGQKNPLAPGFNPGIQRKRKEKEEEKEPKERSIAVPIIQSFSHSLIHSFTH
ncbi:hypothetical protein [Dyadobacter jiangsuensis]|uniref:hypothetical protein n=1 Tax=Dyadobacter jiangsuensis TaxID=1591085 RepID=UPI000D0CCA03|nr:hypothetical protein [Dyadobacter jiangsuensis]